MPMLRGFPLHMPKWFGVSFWTLVLLITAGIALRFGQAESEKATLRHDLALLQDVRYGLFNVDEWKAVLSDIITAKIESFELEDANREEMQAQIERLLRTLVNDLERNYYEDRSSSFIGILESAASGILGVFKQIKKDIPSMAQRIVTFMDDPENRDKIRNYLMDTVDEYAAETFGETNYSAVDQVLDRRGTPAGNRPERMATAVTTIQSRLGQIHAAQFPIKIAGVLLFLITATALFFWAQTHVHIKLVAATLLIWLLSGIQMPMLLIQAKIDHLDFQLLGESFAFSDQVLFQQSKSIWEVVKLLIMEGKGPGAWLAGVGVFLFSILIPAGKLGATLAWKEGTQWSQTWVGKLILFRSAKWAMADVMVVAIFLSHLGFNGILKDQVQRLEGMSPRLDVLTTANSTLLSGFLAFFGFAILGLLLSERLKTLEVGSNKRQ
jgi:membrane-associated HD superfamily phosphohydrolase